MLTRVFTSFDHVLGITEFYNLRVKERIPCSASRECVKNVVNETETSADLPHQRARALSHTCLNVPELLELYFH